MNPNAMRPFGLALLDYHQGNLSSTLVIERDDGWLADLPMKTFFRQARDFELEGKAMDLCRGRVLDVGAGSGIHSLYLQSQDLLVSAIDVSPEAVKVMRERGVKDVRQLDLFDLKHEKFDTTIMMGRGIGVVQTLAGVRRFLAHIRRLLKPAGTVLLTSLDVCKSHEGRDLAYQKNNIERGRYPGEIRMRFVFRDIKGLWFIWLQVDPETLQSEAAKDGWRCRIVSQQDDGNYLASLTSPGP